MSCCADLFTGNTGQIIVGVILVILLPLGLLLASAIFIWRYLYHPKGQHRRAAFILLDNPDEPMVSHCCAVLVLCLCCAVLVLCCACAVLVEQPGFGFHPACWHTEQAYAFGQERSCNGEKACHLVQLCYVPVCLHGYLPPCGAKLVLDAFGAYCFHFCMSCATHMTKSVTCCEPQQGACYAWLGC